MAAVLPPQRQEGTYTFANQPRAVPQRRKYRERFAREEEDPIQYANLMYDRRVVRGNTYSQHTIPTSAQPDPIEIQRQAELRRRAAARKRAQDQLRPRTPDAVDGRQHQDVQTELYLEELSDRIEEADVDCQTDAFLDRPPTPLFVPAKSGADVETQILPGDLFDFNREVKPILEVLVGKTVEQSLLEVLEEEELASLRMQQQEFEELRNTELVEQQRLEEQERRRVEEKKRRMDQQIDIRRKEQETADKIAARAFAQSYLSDLVPTVFGTLAQHGYFFDPIERDVEQSFLPWLMENVDCELESQIRARCVLDGILREVVKERHQAYRILEESIALAKLRAEEENALGGADAAQAEGATEDLPDDVITEDVAPLEINPTTEEAGDQEAVTAEDNMDEKPAAENNEEEADE